MHPEGVELAIPESNLPQTHALNRAATGIGCSIISLPIYLFN